MKHFLDETFERLKSNEKKLAFGEYEECTFKECDFSETDLSNFEFIECRFIDCDLSNAKLKNTSFKSIEFQKCKLFGLRFETTNPFLRLFQFEDCSLDFSSFFELNLKGLIATNTNFKQVDFSSSNLEQAVFQNCNFEGAYFEGTNLKDADMQTSINIVLDLDKNKVDGLEIALNSTPGLLAKYNLKIKP